MRPGREAPENTVGLHPVCVLDSASMRPGREAPENRVIVPQGGIIGQLQ